MQKRTWMQPSADNAAAASASGFTSGQNDTIVCAPVSALTVEVMPELSGEGEGKGSSGEGGGSRLN